jgi:hypothetical protein
MTLMDAKEYDAERARRKRLRVVSIISAVLILGFLAYQFRFWPERRLADKFFSALQKQEFETAYAIYTADPAWKQHPEKHSMYPYNDFYRDWGPGGEWGAIKNYTIYATGECPKGGSGVIVDVVINGRAEHEQLYVEKSDKSFSPSPCS